MRFMMMVKMTPESEQSSGSETVGPMIKYNEELTRAGVMLSGEGLHPSAKGAMVRFGPDGTTTVTDGPFAEAKELVGGFWLIEVSSKEEAIEWARRVPFGDGGQIEIRQVFEA